MSRKRIDELAKEWQVQTRSLLAKLEELGIKGKKAQSPLTDEEAKLVKQALGLIQEPLVPLGQEKTISERLVKEKVAETRIRADAIRRRITRVEVLREPVAVPEEKPGEARDAAPEITEPFEVIPPVAFELPPSQAIVDPPADRAADVRRKQEIASMGSQAYTSAAATGLVTQTLMPASRPSELLRHVPEMGQAADAQRDFDAGLVSATAEMRTQGFKEWVGGSKATLALVFTDIVGSTALGNELGNEEMDEVRGAHFKQARHLISKHRGYEIKTIGDSLMVAFRTAVEAINFALELYANTGHEQVKIRAGIHVGLVHIEKEDAFGTMVNYTKHAHNSKPRIFKAFSLRLLCPGVPGGHEVPRVPEL